jgi:hypothetical protein
MSPPPFALLDLVAARWVSDALAAVTRLGVADAMADGPRPCAEIAAELGLHAESLYRVLRALARHDLLVEAPAGTFGHTDLTRPLATGHPSSMRNMVMELGGARNVEVWARLDAAVRTGAPSWDLLHEEGMWEHLERHPEEHAIFHGAMVELTREAAPAYARGLDFAAHGTVCDLGGGEGQLLASILAVHPAARGVLCDAPKVLARAPEVLGRFGVEERCDIVPCDVLAEVPRGHGIYVAKNIVHGLSDEAAKAALSVWRDALAEDGRLVLIEVVIPEESGPYLAWLDLQMLLVSQGGRERTRAAFAELLAAAGLELERVIETPTPMSMVVARRAKGSAPRASGEVGRARVLGP